MPIVETMTKPLSAECPSRAQSGAAKPGYLSLRGLRKHYGTFAAVDGLDLDVDQGELVAFLGPSGCGKTTCLRMLAGLTPASQGSISVAGRDLTHVPTYQRDMGVVFQSYALFPHLTVARNVAFGLEMRKTPRNEIAQRVEDAIAMVRLSGREGRKPAELSGGQQQRVALARALVVRPSILLLDEPLSNLDAKLRDEMRSEIRDIQRKLGITAIFVTHDQGEALTMCDKVAVMNQGRLEQLGTPQDLYERPASPFVAGFVGRSSRLAGIAAGHEIQTAGGVVRGARRVFGPVQLMVRPHRVAIAAAGPVRVLESERNHLRGRVLRAIYAGDLLQYDVAVGHEVFPVEVSTAGHGARIEPGDEVVLSWQVSDTLVFEGSL